MTKYIITRHWKNGDQYGKYEHAHKARTIAAAYAAFNKHFAKKFPDAKMLSFDRAKREDADGTRW